jgi:hypothetical protein
LETRPLSLSFQKPKHFDMNLLICLSDVIFAASAYK